jgi:hypothetical protein
MSAGPQVDWFSQNAPANAATSSGDWFADNGPSSAEPSTYQKLTAVDQTTQNPALRFLSNVGGAVIGAPAAIGSAILHPVDTVNNIGKSVNDALDTYANPATRPSWEGIKSVLPEALGLGTGNVAAGEIGGAALKGGTAAAKSLVPKGVPEYLYRTALKPSTTIPQARANTMIQTGLQNSIPVSAGGLEKIGSLIDDLNDKIKTTIDNGANQLVRRPDGTIQQGVTVNKFKVASRLGDTTQKFSTQVNPASDLNAISESGNEFLQSQPNEIPASQAQALKQGTYQQLKNAAYGTLKPAAVEAQKALARGIKEELVNQFPEIKDLNAQDSKLIDLDGVLEKAVNRIGNHQVIGIGTPIMAGAAKAVTGSTGAAAVVGMMKGVLDNPLVKSRIAIALARKGVSLPGAMNRISAYSAALGAGANAAQNGGQENQ